MASDKQTTQGLPSDLLLLAAIFLLSSAFYAVFVKPSLTAVGWFTAGILFYLRSRQLTPIGHRMLRIVFWIVGLGILVAIWWPTIR